MGNNLKPPTHEEAVERGRKGGTKKGENYKKRKAMKETIEMILSLDATPKQRTTLKEMGVDSEDLTIQTAVLFAQTLKALDGDLKAAEFLRDTAGEQPVAKTETKTELETGASVQIVLPDNGRDNADH